MKPTRRHCLLAAAGLLAGGAAKAGSYDDFFLGIQLDRVPMVAGLLKRGFDVNARDSAGQHGLYLAIREGSRDVIPVLLEHPGLEVDAANPAGETPLMMAALRGEIGVMKRLIERGAQLELPRWTPLHYAASGPSLEAVRLLLDRGARIDSTAPNGNSPLMMAAGFGSIDSARYLLKRGADPTMRNKQDQTAADLARRGDRDKLADELALAAAR
jgi:ankyrin repeat protein